MIKKGDASIFQAQVQTDIMITGFMAAAVLFFSGLLLTNYNSLNNLIKIPITYLIISTLALLFSSLIMANAASEISQRKIEKAEKHIFFGYALSEYAGIYLMILSIPLIVNIITKDLFLSIVAITGSSLGLMVYQFSHFSIIERHFKKMYNLLSALIIISGIILFLTLLYDYYFISFSLIVLIFIISLVFFAVRKK